MTPLAAFSLAIRAIIPVITVGPRNSNIPLLAGCLWALVLLTRAYGLASIVLYTAGHTGASIEIPGLPMAEAESLRERLGELSGADDAV